MVKRAPWLSVTPELIEGRVGDARRNQTDRRRLAELHAARNEEQA